MHSKELVSGILLAEYLITEDWDRGSSAFPLGYY